MPNIELLNCDCMSYMATLPDKAFDLAIVDPPYGVSYARGKNGFGNIIKNLPTRDDVKWDDATPSDEYFIELFRVSKDQIIWGGNYFNLPVSKCWIVWDKVSDMKLENPFADCELAWTSFSKVIKKITLRQQGFISDTKDEVRIHPTQKPIKLYEWVLLNYCKQSIRCGQKHTSEYDHLCDVCRVPFKILDTHLGSGSSAIAAHKMGFDFVGCELDFDYHAAAVKRFKEQTAQLSLL